MTFTIIEVELDSDPVKVNLSSGIRLEITHQREEGRAKVIFADHIYDLNQIVDTCQTIEKSRVFAILSNMLSDILLLGGGVAYQLRLDGTIANSFNIDKNAYLSEFAYWNLWETPRGLLCIFETGVFMIDAHFNVVWETSKNVLDHFDRIDSEKVWFKFDHDVSWGMSIKDGISDP